MKPTKQDLVTLYNKYGTISGVARELKIPRSTLNYYFRKYQIEVKQGHPKGKRHKQWSQLIKWLKENHAVFPRSISKITKLTGCTYPSVQQYFKRKRKEIKVFVSSLPDLRKTNIKLVTKSGRIFPIRFAKKYTVVPDLWTFQLKVTLYLKPTGKKKITFIVDKEDLIQQ